jgi:hypothetical protein
LIIEKLHANRSICNIRSHCCRCFRLVLVSLRKNGHLVK